MSGVWYQDFGYHIAYTLAFWLFAGIVGVGLARRGVQRAWGHLLTLTWLMSMLLYAHVAYWLVIRREPSSPGLRDLYARSEIDLAGWLGELLETLAGLWGGPLLVVGTVLIAVLVVREREQTRRDVLDVAAVALPFGLAVAKVGCLVAGCCHGVECPAPLGVTFSWVFERQSSYGLTLFPTQLLDVGLLTLSGVLLGLLHRRGRHRGRLMGGFVLLYGVGRFVSEATRGDAETPRILGLSLVQVILLLAVPCAALLLVRGGVFDRLLAWRSRPEPVAVAGVWDDQQHRSIRRQDRLLLATLVVLFPLFPLSPLVGLLAVPLLPIPLLRLLRGRRDPSTWNLLLVLYTTLGFGCAFTVCYLVVPFWPSLLFGPPYLAGWLAILQRRLIDG